jgi:hypothetical protein
VAHHHLNWCPSHLQSHRGRILADGGVIFGLKGRSRFSILVRLAGTMDGSDMRTASLIIFPITSISSTKREAT